MKKLPDFIFHIKRKTGKRYHIKKPTIDNTDPVLRDILISSQMQGKLVDAERSLKDETFKR